MWVDFGKAMVQVVNHAIGGHPALPQSSHHQVYPQNPPPLIASGKHISETHFSGEKYLLERLLNIFENFGNSK